MQKQVFETLVQTASILDNLEINPKAHTTVLNYIVVLSQIQICPLLAKKGLMFKAHFHKFPQVFWALFNIQIAYTPKSEQKRASFFSKPFQTRQVHFKTHLCALNSTQICLTM